MLVSVFMGMTDEVGLCFENQYFRIVCGFLAQVERLGSLCVK